MTKPFVGRCNEVIGMCSESFVLEFEILGEIQNTEILDVGLLVDLVNDSKSGTVFRVCALDRICDLCHENDHSVREALLALIDQILTYDENNQPVEKSEILRKTAFECVCSIYTADDVEGYNQWKKRVADDPSNTIRWLASLNHGQ